MLLCGNRRQPAGKTSVKHISSESAIKQKKSALVTAFLADSNFVIDVVGVVPHHQHNVSGRT